VRTRAHDRSCTTPTTRASRRARRLPSSMRTSWARTPRATRCPSRLARSAPDAWRSKGACAVCVCLCVWCVCFLFMHIHVSMDVGAHVCPTRPRARGGGVRRGPWTERGQRSVSMRDHTPAPPYAHAHAHNSRRSTSRSGSAWKTPTSTPLPVEIYTCI